MVDGRVWLAANIEQARGVSDAAWKTVADFALLWSLFEAELCDAYADAPKLAKLADRFGGSALGEPMHQAFSFWRNRYVEGTGTNERFNELFKKPTGRNIAEPVLLAANPDDASKLRCILIVVYRLRNNLFHGNKEIRSFNDQKQNLDHGIAVLATIMESAGVH